jgi:hypothetical protein
MVKDKAFLAEAEKARLPITYAPGEQIDREIADLYKAPPDIVAKAKAILVR